jgi:LPS export ABC transporter protein LptC
MRKALSSVLFLFTAILLSFCTPKKQTMDILDIENEPDVIIEDFIYSCTTDGRKIWEIKSDKAEKFESARKFLFRTILLKMYEDETVKSILTAKYGVVNYNGKDVTARTNVVLTTSEHTVLYTQSLTWDNERKILRTEDFVRIVKPNGDVLTGYGLEMDQNADRITIKRRVVGVHKGK